MDKLKTNTTSALDAKKLKASLLRTRLKDMAIRDIMRNNESNPDFLDLFGANAEDLLLWLEVTECELKDLEIEYVNQITSIKSCTQLGFQKRKYPQFSGKILDYYEFKQCWFEEVAPERKPEIWELNALMDQIPSLCKNKLHKIKKLDVAWKILDKLYSQALEIIAQLKGQIQALKRKSTKSPEREIELFD